MNYPAAELQGIKRNLLFNPDAEHRGIPLIKLGYHVNKNGYYAERKQSQ